MRSMLTSFWRTELHAIDPRAGNLKRSGKEKTLWSRQLVCVAAASPNAVPALPAPPASRPAQPAPRPRKRYRCTPAPPGFTDLRHKSFCNQAAFRQPTEIGRFALDPYSFMPTGDRLLLCASLGPISPGSKKCTRDMSMNMSSVSPTWTPAKASTWATALGCLSVAR